MFTIECPNCGSKVTFRVGETVFGVCSYCQSALVRSDLSVENIGKVAILQDAWSPLQLYTEGDYRGGHFFIFGRVVYRWERGTWNEWYLSFNDGRTGWLSEAQGHYAFSLPTDDAPPELSTLSAGSKVQLGGVPFTVTDSKIATVEHAEGELPFKALPGTESTTVDLTGALSGPGSTFASIEYRNDYSKVFIGSYEEFDTLHFSNLRELDGW